MLNKSHSLPTFTVLALAAALTACGGGGGGSSPSVAAVAPVPGRNLGASPLGSSVTVAIDVGHTLVISTATMVNAVTGAAVVIRSPITSANDPNAVPGLTYLRSNEGFVSADAPLDAGTAYKVTITGSDNGVAFKQPVSFTFTTGS